MAVFAPALPPLRADASLGPRAAERSAERFCMPFWKMTPPITTDTDVARLRVNPNVAVALAMSRGATRDCKAIRGDWKFVPTPRPATIWKRMMRGQDAYAGREMKRPNPRVMSVRPAQMGGRYCPVLRMNTPVPALTKESDRTKGKRYTPLRSGVAPRTA